MGLLKDKKDNLIDSGAVPIPGCDSCLTADDTCDIGKNGIMVVGEINKGSFSVGDKVRIGAEQTINAVVLGVCRYDKNIKIACDRELAALLLEGISIEQIHKGDLILK